MFSVVVLYSNDRKSQFLKSLECWSDCIEFSSSEKILCVDGQSEITPEGWKVIEIPRQRGLYCWASALNTGVQEATNNSIFYLDSDRILPITFFSECLSLVKDHVFVYPRYLHSLNCDASVTLLRNIRDDISKYNHLLIPDHRQDDPTVFGRKNPFSGCVCFSKSTFIEYGGFDSRFRGWGYPDYDFLMNVTKKNGKLISLDIHELHQKHEYNINKRLFLLHNLWNLNQYILKWNLPKTRIEIVCREHKISQENLYASKTLHEFIARTCGGLLI